jgi:hypothetical protein
MDDKLNFNIKTYVLCIRIAKIIHKLKIIDKDEEYKLYQWAQIIYDMPRRIKYTELDF